MMYLFFSFVAAIAYGQGQLNDYCPEKRPQPMDVFFVVDGSSSIGFWDTSEWPSMLKFVKTIVHESLNVEGDRVGLLHFGSGVNNTKVEYELGVDSRQQIVDTVQGIHQIGGGTPTRQAVELAMEKLITVEPHFEDRTKLLVLITDGHPSLYHNPCMDDTYGVPITDVRDKLDANNIKTVVIAIRNYGSKIKCLVEDPDVNIVNIPNFHTFEEYRDPTGDENLLCVDPKEFVLECCRVAVTYPESSVLKQSHDLHCRKFDQPNCMNRVGTAVGSCKWGTTYEGDVIDGCGVTAKPTTVEDKPTSTPTVQPTLEPTNMPTISTFQPTLEPTNNPTIPTFQPTFEPTGHPISFCSIYNNCIVKGGTKLSGKWKTVSACACSDECSRRGGTEAKWHTKRHICKCWKASARIELQRSPFEPNAKHGGNAGGMTQCVKIIGSLARIVMEVPKTESPTTFKPSPFPTDGPTTPNPTPSPTPIPTPFPTKTPTPSQPTPLPTTFKSTYTVSEWQKRCSDNEKRFAGWKVQFPWDVCFWVADICDFRCNGA